MSQATPTFMRFSIAAGQCSDLGTLGGNASVAQAINSAGTRAFLYTSGTMLDLNSLVNLNTTLLSASGINNSGQITAVGANQHAYLLTPVTTGAGGLRPKNVK